MKTEYYYIFAIVLLILIGIGIYSYIRQVEQHPQGPNITTVPTDEESCKATGGDWVRAGLAQEFRCVHKYSDGGKPCNSSTECKGSCISKDDGTGYCKNDDNPFGCYHTIEDFRAGMPALCVD